MNIKKRVLVGSPIRQEPAILKEFLNSLKELEQETVELNFLFIDDNDNLNSSKILDEFANITPNVMIHKHSSIDTYVRNEVTHSWNEQLVWKVAQLKNMIIQIAIEFNYDYLFFIDSDIVLHPRTIEQLKNAGKEIISEIFWTKWQPDFPELPQVWIEDHYTMYYKHRNEQITSQEALSRQEKFLSCLRKPGVYEVGGLGACTLISREALLKGVNFKEIKNISFWGEDRHFCIRAAALGISLFVDTHFPAYHIYRESDLEGLPVYKGQFTQNYCQETESSDNKTIIILSSICFREDLWQRPQQLALQFRKMNYNVVFVNNLSITASINQEYDKYTTDTLFFNSFNDLKKEEGVIIVNPICFLNDVSKKEINVKTQYITQLINYFSTNSIQILCYLPDYFPILDVIKKEFPKIEIFYDCVDEMSSFGNSKNTLYEETNLLNLSDGVIVTSNTLYVHKGAQNDKCILVPNAVSYSDFIDKHDTKMPIDLQELKGPIIGYVGAISSWFDQELLIEVAKLNPHYNFVLIGTVYTEVSKMLNQKNIIILGRKEYSEVPIYMSFFNASIIPFKLNDLIINTNPVKYYEYLASGLNTVSTPLPELINLPFCYLASTPQEFSEKIQEALETKVELKIAEEYLVNNTWEKRAREIINFMRTKTNKINRKEKLKSIVHSYEEYGENDIINILSAEIYEELGQTNLAKAKMNRVNDMKICSLIQAKLYLQWAEYKKVISLIPIVYKSDLEFWETRDKEYLKMYLFRIIGELNKSFEMAENLIQKDNVVNEEIGNIFFDSGQYTKAAEFYLKTYNQSGRLMTYEAAKNFSFIASDLNKNVLAQDILRPFHYK